MFDRIFNQALREAGIEPDQFDAAIRKLKYTSRLDWFMRGAPLSVVAAYNARIEQERTDVRSA